MNALVHTTGLSKRYGRTAVVDHLDLTLEEGSVYGLVGANGAGKTTTVKLLMNIIEVTSGQATVLDTDSRLLGPRQFQQIGYVSENQAMPEWMTVAYLMAYLKPFYPRWDDGRAKELVQQFDLPPDRPLRHLSRGMRMKVALASSLAYRPRLLVLDEPFSGLDSLVRDEFIESLVECAQETTMLIASHDLAEIESFATHIGFLDSGRLLFSQSMTVLSDRFREIEVTLDADVSLPQNWPRHWLHLEASPRLVRFVDSAFDGERTVADVHQLLGHRAEMAANPMSLRAIFVTLARQSRKAA